MAIDGQASGRAGAGGHAWPHLLSIQKSTAEHFVNSKTPTQQITDHRVVPNRLQGGVFRFEQVQPRFGIVLALCLRLVRQPDFVISGVAA